MKPKVSTEQIDKAAQTDYEEFSTVDLDDPLWHELTNRQKSFHLMRAQFMFRAAGFSLEGE